MANVAEETFLGLGGAGKSERRGLDHTGLPGGGKKKLGFILTALRAIVADFKQRSDVTEA